MDMDVTFDTDVDNLIDSNSIKPEYHDVPTSPPILEDHVYDQTDLISSGSVPYGTSGNAYTPDGFGFYGSSYLPTDKLEAAEDASTSEQGVDQGQQLVWYQNQIPPLNYPITQTDANGVQYVMVYQPQIVCSHCGVLFQSMQDLEWHFAQLQDTTSLGYQSGSFFCS